MALMAVYRRVTSRVAPPAHMLVITQILDIPREGLPALLPPELSVPQLERWGLCEPSDGWGPGPLMSH